MILQGHVRSRILNYLDRKIYLLLACEFIPTVGTVKLHSQIIGDDTFRGKGFISRLMAEYPHMYKNFMSEALGNTLNELSTLLLLLISDLRSREDQTKICYLPVSKDIEDMINEMFKTNWFLSQQVNYQIHELSSIRMMLQSFCSTYREDDNYGYVNDFLSKAETLIRSKLHHFAVDHKLEIKTVLYLYQILTWLLHNSSTMNVQARFRDLPMMFDTLKGTNLTNETVALCPPSMLPYARAFQEEHYITQSVELKNYLAAAYEVIQLTKINEGNKYERRYIGPYRYFNGGHPRYGQTDVRNRRNVRPGNDYSNRPSERY